MNGIALCIKTPKYYKVKVNFIVPQGEIHVVIHYTRPCHNISHQTKQEPHIPTFDIKNTVRHLTLKMSNAINYLKKHDVIGHYKI